MFITRMLLVLVLLVLIAVPAEAAQRDRDRRTIHDSPHLWATVNICDSEESPDTVGVRASMPGSGRRRERMYMRFRVQYRAAEEQRWHDFEAEGAGSGWVRVGHGGFRARRSGWRFPFVLEAGQRYVLRGVVNFEWRRGRRVVRRATLRTRSGHRTRIAEPRGYSAANCVLTG